MRANAAGGNSTSAATGSGNPGEEAAGTGRTINIDIRAEQQAARGAAFSQALAAGKSEIEAENLAAAVGNNVGAAALSRIKL
jgi:hypothetical protein